VKFENGKLHRQGPQGRTKDGDSQGYDGDDRRQPGCVTRPSDLKQHRALHGTTRANIQNMVIGVTDGYKKTLELVGVGYKVELNAGALILNIGFSHQMAFIPPTGINFEVATPTQLHISGIDKQLVGQMTAKIRAVRPPEPYKGKGIKYAGELIRRKAGKTAKS
jgi:large subunit ribosomal protein L6